MKKLFSLLILAMLIGSVAFAQNKEVKTDIGADVVSRYINKGWDVGNSPAIQPEFTITRGKATIGAWGSYGLNSNIGTLETHLFAKYNYKRWVFIVTDYYFPGEKYDNGKVLRHGNWISSKTHAIELEVNHYYKNWNFVACHVINGDTYGEIGYRLGGVNLFIGGGNGAYTVDGKFGICNTGIEHKTKLKISDEFTLPIFGKLVINPSSEQLHMVFGCSI